MKKKKRCIRIAAFLLIFSMLFSIFPSALAEEMAQDASETQTVQSEADEASQEVLPDAPIDAAETEVVEESADVAPETDEASAIEESAPEAQPDEIPAGGISTYEYFQTDGRTITLYAKVVDENGNPLSVKTVTPKIESEDDVTVTTQTGTTDSKGLASFEFTIDEWPLGTSSKTYSVSFSTESQIWSSPTSLTVTVTRTWDWDNGLVSSYTSSTTENTQTLTVGKAATTNLPSKDDFKVTKAFRFTDPGAGEGEIEFVIPGLSGSVAKDQEVVLAIDLSGSMNDKLGSSGQTRLEILQEALTKKDGFIDELFTKNPNAKLGIVTFSGTASIKKNRNENFFTVTSKDSAKNTINGLSASGGTNFIDALDKAGSLFTNYDTEKKLIFLSDGSPSRYKNSQGGYSAGYYSGGAYGQIPNKRTYNDTKQAITDFFSQHPNVTAYGISYGTKRDNLPGSQFGLTPYVNSNSNGDNYSDRDIGGYFNFLEDIASKGKTQTYATKEKIPTDYLPQNVFAATDSTDLTNILTYLSDAHLSDITLTDTMTDCVTIPDTTKIQVYDTINYDAQKPDQVKWSETDKEKYAITGAGSNTIGTISFNEIKGQGQAYKVVIPVKLTDAAYLSAKEGKTFDTNVSSTAAGNILGFGYTKSPDSPQVTLPVTSVTLNKIGENQEKIQGAKFTLWKQSVDNPENKLEWATDVTTDENGTLVFDKLPIGTYYLKETVAPAGYELNTNIYTFNVVPSKSPEADAGAAHEVDAAATSFKVSDGKYEFGYINTQNIKLNNEVITFKNRKSEVDLTLTKKVEGQLGDKSKVFSFTVSQEGEDNKTINLTDGQSEMIKVKRGKDVTIKETNADGYETSWSIDPSNSLQTSSGPSVTIKVDTTQALSVTCTNTASAKPVTGFRQDIFPFVGGLVVIGIGVLGVYLIGKRRKGNA